MEDLINNTNLEIDDNLSELNDVIPSTEPTKTTKRNTTKEVKRVVETPEKELINCLSATRVFVRYIPKEGGMVTNPKHILYGGMAENAVRYFTVPRLSSGMFVNVLTDSEKEYLEEIMGLEYNALSIYKKEDNFWENKTVRLTKQDNVLDLSSPDDFIKYKILLANKDLIAASLEVRENYPKVTYQFVLIVEGEENKTAATNMSNTMQCYKEYGKIETDVDLLRVIVETIEGRPTSPNVKLEFLQTKVNQLIQADSKLFLRVIKDNLLSTKVLIKKAVEKGVISHRGTYFYDRRTNTPLCNDGEEPVLNMAAKFLNNPKNQELKLSIEAKIK